MKDENTFLFLIRRSRVANCVQSTGQSFHRLKITGVAETAAAVSSSLLLLLRFIALSASIGFESVFCCCFFVLLFGVLFLFVIFICFCWGRGAGGTCLRTEQLENLEKKTKTKEPSRCRPDRQLSDVEFASGHLNAALPKRIRRPSASFRTRRRRRT